MMKLALGLSVSGGKRASAPTFSSLNYSLADIAGGDVILVNGANFVSGATVTFGGTAGTVTIVSAAQLSVVTPAKAAGTYDVVITNPDGQAVTSAGAYEAWSPASVTGVDAYFDSRKGLTLSGSNVTTWTEQTGSRAYNANAGNEPTRVLSTFGSVQAVRIDKTSVNQWVRGTRRALASGVSYFFVGKWTSSDTTDGDNSNNVPLTVVGDSTVSVVQCGGASAGTLAYAVLGSTTTRGTSLNDGTTRLVGWTHATNNDLKAYSGTTQQGATATPAWQTGSGYDSIGCGRSSSGTSTTGGDSFDGHLGAVVVCNAVISAGDLTKLHRWAQVGFGAAA